MFDQTMIHAMARKAEAWLRVKQSLQQITDEEKNMKETEGRPKDLQPRKTKNSTFLTRCMHVRTRNPCDRTDVSSKIENIKKRLQQKLGIEEQKLRSSKIQLSSESSNRFNGGDYGLLQLVSSEDPMIINGGYGNRGGHGVKQERNACPRCGRWCKYSGRSKISVLVCPSCCKKFHRHKESNKDNSSRFQNSTKMRRR